MSAWRTVAEAKVVYFPLVAGKKKDGEDKIIFIRVGIRIEMADGTWWFHHFKFGSWTHHFMGADKQGTGFYASQSKQVERKESYTPKALQREYGGRGLVEALESGVQQALEAEAEKRAA